MTKQTTSESGVSKYKVVFDALRQGIASGRYASGARLPTEAEVTEQFGVSRVTAVRAFRDLEQLGLITRRRGAGSFVAPRQVEPGKTFGVIISGIFPAGTLDDTFFSGILGEMTAYGSERGVTFLLQDPLIGRDPDILIGKAQRLAAGYREKGVDGVFFAPLMLPADKVQVNRQILETFIGAGIPVVLIDRDLEPFPVRTPHNLVGIDHFRAGWLLAGHLIRQGARSIGFFAGAEMVYSIEARLAGCWHALRENGIDPQSAWVWRGPTYDEVSFTGALKAAKVDAWICYNDAVAAFMQREMLKAGLRVPEDVMLAGVDNTLLAAHLPVPLTSVSQPCPAIGRAAVEVMLSRLARPSDPPRSILFEAELVPRRSTRGNTGTP